MFTCIKPLCIIVQDTQCNFLTTVVDVRLIEHRPTIMGNEITKHTHKHPTIKIFWSIIVTKINERKQSYQLGISMRYK